MPLSTEILPYARQSWVRCTGNNMTKEQESDLIHLCSYRKSGIAASRGYGKTLMLTILETYLASHYWLVTHIFNGISQADAWYMWMRRLGWKVTQWSATYSDYTVRLRLYGQGRGPRCDFIANDELGTVISDIERAQFAACQEMLSGSRLGMVKYAGTRDPNSIWSKYEQNVIIRPYDPVIMPWTVMQYEDARRHNPPAYMDCEYHMRATPAGGLILTKTHVIDFLPSHVRSKRYGIDPNPVHGLYVVGSYVLGMDIWLTEAYVFDTLEELADFMYTHKDTPFELEMNGVGGVVAMYLREQRLNFVECWSDDHLKVDRAVYCAVRDIWVPAQYEFDVLPILTRQIWDGKKVMKFNDAHYFDAFWLSVGVNPTGYVATGPKAGQNLSILQREKMRHGN